jgi:SAM-dependent methyltransferase
LRVLDVACGTGEASARVLELWPEATLIGIDVDAAHLTLARQRCAGLGGRAEFAVGDAFALGSEDGGFDLVLCRHLLQAVPEPERVIAELVRVTAPGGRVHLIAEDYGLMHFHPARLDSDAFWRDGAMAFAAATGSDLKIGRKAPALLRAAGLAEVTCEYVIVDTLRVAPRVFADIWRAWRDGYAEAVAAHSRFSVVEVVAYFDDMIACIEDPGGYAVWHVPVVSGRKRGDASV